MMSRKLLIYYPIGKEVLGIIDALKFGRLLFDSVYLEGNK